MCRSQRNKHNEDDKTNPPSSYAHPASTFRLAPYQPGIAMLILEDNEGHYEPINLASTIDEAPRDGDSRLAALRSRQPLPSRVPTLRDRQRRQAADRG